MRGDESHFRLTSPRRKYYTKKEDSILAKALPDTIILELDQRSLRCDAMYDVKDALQVLVTSYHYQRGS